MDSWKAADDVMDTMKDLVANYHPDLALYVDEIAIIFKEKASSVGDKVIPGKTAKAPAILHVLGIVGISSSSHLLLMSGRT